MLDPRSLRFGFGLGVCLLAAVLIWLIWPANPHALDGTPESPQMTAPAVPAVPISDSAAKGERNEAAPTANDPAPAASQPLKNEPATSGRIQLLDRSTGAPLPQFDVIATSRDGVGSWAQTDAAGWLTLADSATAGAWQLTPQIEQNGLWSIKPELTWSDPENEARAYLERAEAELHIEVRGPTGLPVAGASVDLAGIANERARTLLSYETDLNGSVRLPWPPDGLETDRWLATAWHTTEGSCLPTQIQTRSLQATTLLQLQAGASLSLRVSDSVRGAYPGLQVRVRSLSLSKNAFVQQMRNGREYLDADGTKSWTQLAPGEYKISLRSPIGFGWLERELTMTEQDQHIDWVIETPPRPVALEGKLESTDQSFVPIHHYVQLFDAETGELISGTRTDGLGRFQLFGEASGEVILLTDLLESEWGFPPHEHRFTVGQKDVVVQGGYADASEHDFRILDSATKSAIPRARLVRTDSEFDAFAGLSNSIGVLRAEIRPHWTYLLQANGYQPLRLSGDPSDWPRTIYLEPTD